MSDTAFVSVVLVLFGEVLPTRHVLVQRGHRRERDCT